MFEVGTNEPVPSLSRLFLFGSDSAHRCEALQLDPNSFRPFLISMGDGQAHPACSPPTRLSGVGWEWVGLRAGDWKPVFGTAGEQVIMPARQARQTTTCEACGRLLHSNSHPRRRRLHSISSSLLSRWLVEDSIGEVKGRHFRWQGAPSIFILPLLLLDHATLHLV